MSGQDEVNAIRLNQTLAANLDLIPVVISAAVTILCRDIHHQFTA
jgi:hypothetical protein